MGFQFPTELPQFRLFDLRRNDRNRGGSNIDPHIPCANLVFRFVIRIAFTDKLDSEAVSTVDLPPHDPYILYPASQPMLDHRIGFPGIDRLQYQPLPLHLPLSPHDPRLVALAFYQVNLVFAFEARTTGSTSPNPQHRFKRPRRYLLYPMTVQMISQPAVPKLFGIVVQRIFAKLKPLPDSTKRRSPSLLCIRLRLAFRQFPRRRVFPRLPISVSRFKLSPKHAF